MRLQPKNTINSRGKILGGPKPLVCIPLVGNKMEDVTVEARNIPILAPDAVELRVDAWDFIEDLDFSVSMIGKVRNMIGEFPIILTCRSHKEGGFKEVPDEAKFALYETATEEKLVDYIDVELSCGADRIDTLRRLLESCGISMIISYHDFEKTPARDEILSILASEIESGAMVGKIAVMPECEEDVLCLMSATLETRRRYPDVPLITMSMGEMGSISRVSGGFFGSDLTFAVGSKASAPGQISVDSMKRCFEVLYS